MVGKGKVSVLLFLCSFVVRWCRCEDVRRCKKEDVRIVYLILAHNEATLESSSRLIDVLWDANDYFLVHIDAKYHGIRRNLIEALKKRDNVEWSQIYDVRWARWSMVEPTLWAMERAVSKEFDFFINLSGDSWPVLKPKALRASLGALYGLNFMASSPQSPTGLRATARSEFGDGWHKKEAYPEPMLTEVPDLEAHYGSQWMILSRDFIGLILSELKDPKSPASLLRDWFMYAFIHVKGVGSVRPHIPDETYFPSLLAYYQKTSIPSPIEFYLPCSSSSPPSTINSLRFLQAAFYIRMDEHYPWSPPKQRYAAPHLEKSERPWGPYFLGAYDLYDIKASGAFFIRKVSHSVDPNIFSFLPVDHHDHIPPLAWPRHSALSLSSPPTDFQIIDRGHNETGCIRVAESIHCPPQHRLDPDVDLAFARLLQYKPTLSPGPQHSRLFPRLDLENRNKDNNNDDSEL